MSTRENMRLIARVPFDVAYSTSLSESKTCQNDLKRTESCLVIESPGTKPDKEKRGCWCLENDWKAA